MRLVDLGCAVVVFSLALGCDSDGDSDVDSGGADAGALDAGGMRRDAGGEPDAGAPRDAGGSDAGGSDAGTTEALGTATVVGSCDLGLLDDRQSCTQVEVACDDTPARIAEVLVAHGPTTPDTATIMMAATGPGSGYLEADCAARPITCTNLNGLTADGFRVVQFRWAADWFLNEAGGGLVANGCRTATLMRWVHDNVHAPPSGAFCTFGNSGGAAQMAYPLTHFGMGPIVDYALLNGGPVTSVVDRMCLDEADPTWLAECHDRLRVFAAQGWNCAEPSEFDCDYFPGPGQPTRRMDKPYPGTPCTDRDESFRAIFLEDSLTGPTAVNSFPGTTVDVVFGRDDCTPGVITGLRFADAVGANVRLIAGGHVSYANAGAPELRDLFNAHCR